MKGTWVPLSLAGMATLATIFGAGCGSTQNSGSVTEGSAATPAFSLTAGTYAATQSVTISDATPGATIYYTTNGTAPTTESTAYSAAISVGSTETLNAIAVAGGYTPSPIASAAYVITTAAGAGQWTWISGSDTDSVAGVYGTKGVSSAGDAPGAREGNSFWADNQGHLWVFGGQGLDSDGSFSSLNDLWSYSISTGQWTWVSGSNTADAPAVYGTQGVAASTNVPGARNHAASWVDANGDFWVFGGQVDGFTGALGDLWMFNPSTLMWTWEGGQDSMNPVGVYGTIGAPSTNNRPGGRAQEVTWTDSAGNFWLFGGDGIDVNGKLDLLNDLWKFDPATKEWTWVSGSDLVDGIGVYGSQGVASSTNVPGARFDGVGWSDSQGNFWIFGGGSSDGIFQVLNDLWMFNPNTGQWTWVSGSSNINDLGTYGMVGVPAPGNVPGARQDVTGWADANSNLYLIGGSVYGVGNTDADPLNDLWVFDATTKMWTWIGGSDVPGVPGIYGVEGVSSPGNDPGSVASSSACVDKSGNFWLFGGYTQTATSSAIANDLWRYVP